MSSSDEEYIEEYLEDGVDVVDDLTSEKEKELTIQKMKSIFIRPDVILVVEGEELHIQKSELMEKSSVFKAMLSSPFKEKASDRIELPGKKLEHFLIFLRCLLSGINDQIDMSNVYIVVPLAHEYQVESILSKADQVLKDYFWKCGFRNFRSRKIVENILFAEKYTFNNFLETLVDFASRKLLKQFSAAEEFDKISAKVLNEIAMTRWKNNVNPVDGKNSVIRYQQDCVT